MNVSVLFFSAQAFELRYKQMLKRKKQPVVVPDRYGGSQYFCPYIFRSMSDLF